jgi:hypothetical protein
MPATPCTWKLPPAINNSCHFDPCRARARKHAPSDCRTTMVTTTTGRPCPSANFSIVAFPDCVKHRRGAAPHICRWHFLSTPTSATAISYGACSVRLANEGDEGPARGATADGAAPAMAAAGPVTPVWGKPEEQLVERGTGCNDPSAVTSALTSSNGNIDQVCPCNKLTASYTKHS